jgi:hypothetical protein
VITPLLDVQARCERWQSLPDPRLSALATQRANAFGELGAVNHLYDSPVV